MQCDVFNSSFGTYAILLCVNKHFTELKLSACLCTQNIIHTAGKGV